MKKFLLLASLCLAICSGVSAQDFQGRQGGQRGQRGNRMQIDMVVDTAIINHMDLSEEVLQQVYQLQEKKHAEQKEAMSSMKRGQRMNEEELKAFMDRQQEFNAQYRKELRALLGDEAYIAYLEKMLDRRPSFGMMRGRGQMGGQRPMGGGDFGGQGFGGGGFGGGDGFGGGF